MLASMARQQQTAQKFGRPQLPRLEDEDIAFIKAEVAESNESKRFVAAQFHREIYEETTNGSYKGLPLPSDVESVKSAFDGAFKPNRKRRDSLPELYYRVLEALYGIERTSLPSRRSTIQSDAQNRETVESIETTSSNNLPSQSSHISTPTTPCPQQPVGDILGDELATRELDKAIMRLGLETDSELVAREAAALIAECEYLIHTRTSQQNMLQTARRALEAVTQAARIKLDLAGDVRLRQQWAELIICGLAGLAACHNHIGSVGPQDDIETEISEVLAKNARLLPGSSVQKAELLHEIKIRTLNKLFNDYRFKQAADRLECEIQGREQLIPSGVADELLGKMLGSVGQAYAFMSRTEADKYVLARKYFEKSLAHFEPGTYFHSMSVNFLATLAWQEGNLDLACQSMGRHAGLQPLVSAEEFRSKFRHYFFQANMSAFDVVNYARILGSLCEASKIDVKYLREVVNHWKGRLLDEHPHEQLAKWLAFALYRSGDVVGAIELCKRGVTISRKLEFTVQTIGLSILGLLSACYATQKNTALHLDSVSEFDRLASNLVGRSASFRDYLGNVGGVGGLHICLKDSSPGNVANITRFLPFTYA